MLSPLVIRKGAEHSVYLTFDDGPHPQNSIKIIDTLNKYHQKAHFFWLGKEMQRYPQIVEHAKSHGHRIGYHSYDHKSTKTLSFRHLYADFKCIRQLEQQYQLSIDLYRPPYGELTLSLLLCALLFKVKIVMWSKDSRDSYDDSVTIEQTVQANQLAAGEILLFHDDYDKTAELLDKMLSSYQANNVNIGVL